MALLKLIPIGNQHDIHKKDYSSPAQARIAPWVIMTSYLVIDLQTNKKQKCYSRALGRPHQISVKKYGAMAVEETLKIPQTSVIRRSKTPNLGICTNNGCGLDYAQPSHHILANFMKP
jgi:hypothetical protein